MNDVTQSLYAIPGKWLHELLALCGPEDHELRERIRAALAAAPQVPAPAQAEPVSDEPPFLHRLRVEQRELQERYEKLEAFLPTLAFSMLDNDDADLLVKQSIQQHSLLQTLNQRIHSATEKHLRSKNHE